MTGRTGLMGVRQGWAFRIGATAAVLAGVGVPAAYAVNGAAPSGAVAAATVKVDVGGKGACSGALISPWWVITAKSCFEETTGTAVVKGAPKVTTTATIGRVDLTGSTGKVVGVSLVVPHADRDVVLARLASPVTDVAPVKVASTAPVVGNTLTVTGYGRTTTSLVPDTAHSAAYAVTSVAAGTLDIQASAAGATICKGDAGGPALRTTSTGVELVAIHHSAYQGGCLGATNTLQGATETRLDNLRDWITQTTQVAPIKYVYTANGGQVWEAASNNGWKNLNSQISTSGAVAALEIDGVKYVYTVVNGQVWEAASNNGWKNLNSLISTSGPLAVVDLVPSDS